MRLVNFCMSIKNYFFTECRNFIKSFFAYLAYLNVVHFRDNDLLKSDFCKSHF